MDACGDDGAAAAVVVVVVVEGRASSIELSSSPARHAFISINRKIGRKTKERKELGIVGAEKGRWSGYFQTHTEE